MGFELHGRGNKLLLNIAGWQFIFELAIAYGWMPLGTEPTDLRTEDGIPFGAQENWSGSYFSNDWQIITEQDAANLAAALQRALEDLPEQSRFFGYYCRMIGCDVRSSLSGARTPSGQELVREVIALCRSGRIYIS